jgi:putative acetyltransferase
MTELSIRAIRPADDAAVAAIIREVMTAFGASGEGFAIHDAEVDDMSGAYAAAGHAYFVIEEGGHGGPPHQSGRVLGGAGIAPLAGTDDGTCELRKMYFVPAARATAAATSRPSPAWTRRRRSTKR